MSAHAPKQRALEAYLAGQLSSAGRKRLEGHLAGCEVCRGARERMDLYHTTADELRLATLPDIDWDRIERALEHQPKPAAPREGRPRWLWPAVAVAAAALIGWLEARPQGETPSADRSVADSQVAEPQAPEPALQPAHVTLAANDVRVSQAPTGEPAEPLDVVTELLEGQWLRTGPEAALHVRLRPDTGLALGADAALHLSRLREGETKLRLAKGSVSLAVAPLARSEHFEVTAGAYRVVVQGTRFEVQLSERRTVRVQVSEGTVQVLRGEALVATLEAGSSWVEPEAGVAAPTVETGAADPAPIVGLQSAAAEAWLEVPSLPMVQAWLPAGDAAPIEAAGGLRMRLPPGRGSLRVLDRKARVREITFELAPEGTELTERELQRQLAPATPRWGTLEVPQIMPVLQRGMGGLRSCYERALRGGHSGSAELSLRLRVSSTGQVDQVRVEGEGLEPTLVRCLQSRASRWRFPPPEGGPAHLQLPVNLRPKRR